LSNSLWSGNRPKSDIEAKARLCEAALECIKRSNIDKTTMSDIAKQAGITRPTLYKHFKNKNDIFFAAIDAAALLFAESVVGHAKQFASFEERVIETIVFVVTELPRHRHLSLVLNNDCAEALRKRAFYDEATLVFTAMAAQPLIEVRPDIKGQSIEIAEIMARFAISVILFPGKFTSDYKGLRELIKKRILPGLQ
jgi:AcrR family transcriptional regulator